MRESKKLLSEAIDLADFSYDCINDLGTLFKAIENASEEHSAAHNLAKIGNYLTDDWGNGVDVQRDNLEAERSKL